MRDESHEVPYTASPLLGRTVLVLAPHPDDELLGCGGTIAQNVRNDSHVTVVVITDGTAHGQPDDLEQYRQLRESETIAGLELLGCDPPTFLRLPDRSLAGDRQRLLSELRTILFGVQPDLVFAPSPIEVHPDHRSVAEGLLELLRSEEARSALTATRLAFYEVSQPMRPNLLVDISAVFDRKIAAVRKHVSQQGIRDYASFISGLNSYRAMTLPPRTRAAEAFWVKDVGELADVPLEVLREQIAGSRPIRVAAEAPTVSVIVRTKDRLHLVREAIDSIRACSYPAAIVVVNASAGSIREDLGNAEVHLIERGRDLGRSEAMNEGVAAATTTHLAFLDDDDRFFPEHIGALAKAVSDGTSDGVYSDAISVTFERAASGEMREANRVRRYAHDFDRDLLLFDNYIPLTTLLVSRSDFNEAGGFDAALDVFEDWDFLLRLTRNRTLRRLPRLTCEIRHFPDSGSAVYSMAPESFRRAKLAVWERHHPLSEPSALVHALESYKQIIAGLEQHIASRERQDAEVALDLKRARRRIAETSHALTQLKAAIGYELALYPKRRARVQSLVEAHAGSLARAVGELFLSAPLPPPPPLRQIAGEGSVDTSIAEIAELRQQLDQTRAELRKIHESQLWKLGSLYWRFLHAIGLLRMAEGRGDGRR